MLSVRQVSRCGCYSHCLHYPYQLLLSTTSCFGGVVVAIRIALTFPLSTFQLPFYPGLELVCLCCSKQLLALKCSWQLPAVTALLLVLAQAADVALGQCANGLLIFPLSLPCAWRRTAMNGMASTQLQVNPHGDHAFRNIWRSPRCILPAGFCTGKT